MNNSILKNDFAVVISHNQGQSNITVWTLDRENLGAVCNMPIEKIKEIKSLLAVWLLRMTEEVCIKEEIELMEKGL